MKCVDDDCAMASKDFKRDRKNQRARTVAINDHSVGIKSTDAAQGANQTTKTLVQWQIFAESKLLVDRPGGKISPKVQYESPFSQFTSQRVCDNPIATGSYMGQQRQYDVFGCHPQPLLLRFAAKSYYFRGMDPIGALKASALSSKCATNDR
jgi:hypothetical protein